LCPQAVVVILVSGKEGTAHELKNLSSSVTEHMRKGVVLDMRAPAVAVGPVRGGGTAPVGVGMTDEGEEGTYSLYASLVKSPCECGSVG
jgi:hypothetical protein